MYGLIYTTEVYEAMRAIEDRAYMVIGPEFANLLLNAIESHLEYFSRYPLRHERKRSDLPKLDGMIHPFAISDVMGFRCDAGILYRYSRCEMNLYLLSIGCEWRPI